MSDDLYRVLYMDNEGHEQLTGAMPYDVAYSRAKALEEQGHAVGSVMGDVAARGYMHARYGGQPNPADEPKTYRGVQVPRECRAYDGKPTQQFRLGVDAALGVAAPLVESLRSEEPCHLDHHGYCQEHGLPGAIPCPDGEARKFLAATKEGSKP